VSVTPAAGEEVIHVARPFLGAEEAAAVQEVIASGWIAQGPRVAAFESAFASVQGTGQAVALTSCTTALHLALLVYGIGPGDDVVVPSLSFIATANAARYVGARPVFADVDLVTAALTVDTVQAALTPATRAVVLAHQGGVPADADALRQFCTARDLTLVEDAACAAGSTLRGRPVGQGALVAAWSFHPRKVITTGEGGMITTDDPAIASRLRRLREHGMSVSAAERHGQIRAVQERYLEVGFNFRMTDLQAAIGLVQLGRMAGLVAERRALAARYHALLADVEGITCVRDPAYGTTNYQSFWVVLTDARVDRDDVLDRLAEAGISARRGIMAAHLEPAYAGERAGPLPATETLTRRSLILPLFPGMTEGQQQRVVGALRAALTGHPGSPEM
jgi:perosamine synthetase